MARNFNLKFGKACVVFIVFFAAIFGIIFVSSASILDQLHLNIQTTDTSGNVVTGTYDFVFNISTTSNCANVVYSNSTTLTTDSRGIISYYLENTNLNYNEQYYLCHYRDGSLIDTSEIARTPYSFNAQNTTLSGMAVDTNLNLGSYNATATYYFGSGRYLTEINSSAVNLSTVNYWSLNGTSLYYNGGNVGIGTGSPTQKLDVAGNINAYQFYVNGTPLSTTTGTITGTGTYGYIPMWNSTTSLNNSAIFQNGSNVGIGTTNPGAKLDVAGGIRLTGASQLIQAAPTSGYISNLDLTAGLLDAGYGNSGASIRLQSADANANGYIMFSTNQQSVGAFERMRITNAGNVGIGTTGPDKKLHIEAAQPWIGYKIKDTTTTGGRGVENDILDGNNDGWRNYFGGHYSGQYLAWVPLNAGVAGSNVLTLLDTGNVGIGTTGPNAKLHVNGSAIINGTLIGLSNATDLTGAVTLSQLQAVNTSATASETDPYWTGNSTLVPYLASANTFTNNNIFNQNLTVDGTTFFVNSNTNNVGIGTTNPNSKLEVAGTFNTTSGGGILQVDSSGNVKIGL